MRTVLLSGALGAAFALSGASARAATTVLTASADQATLQPWDAMVVTDPSATDGKAVEFYWTGALQFQLHLLADADTVALRLHGDQCSGPPAYTITIDGVPAVSDTVTSTTWVTKSY